MHLVDARQQSRRIHGEVNLLGAFNHVDALQLSHCLHGIERDARGDDVAGHCAHFGTKQPY